jgi:hypothetical protein
LVPAVFVVVGTHLMARVVGYGPFSLYVIHKEGLCPSSGGNNRLMMIHNEVLYPSSENINAIMIIINRSSIKLINKYILFRKSSPRDWLVIH